MIPLVFLFSASQVLAFSENEIELNKNDINLILGNVSKEISNQRINLSSPPNIDSKVEIVLALLDTGIKTNSFQYLMVSAPKEVAKEIFKMGSKIFSLFYDPSLSSILEFGTDEAKKALTDWLVRNELRVGSGKISIPSYKTVDGQITQAEFPFLITYNPAKGDVEINIYSSKSLYPPETISGFTNYGTKGENFRIYDKELIPPFILKVSGKIKPGTYGGFVWTQNPRFDIDFDSSVPEIDIREISALEKYYLELNKKALAIQNALDILKNSVSSLWDKIKAKFSQLGKASISSFFSSDNQEQTVVSLKDEVSSIKKIIEEEPALKGNKEVENLKEKIAELESELAKGFPEESPAVKRVEVNSAGKDELTRIIHIGDARAQEIIRLRPFTSLDDLLRVSGIGAKTLQDIKDQGIAYVLYEGEIKEEEKKEEKEKKEKEENPCDTTGVDINRANLKDLTYITGVGEVIAQRIIDYRSLNSFHSLDDLLNVSGIAQATLEKIKNQGCAYVENSSSPSPIQPKKEDPAKIKLSIDNLFFVWDEGESMKEIVTISNTGGQLLTWSMTKDDWILSDSLSGQTEKETKVTISVDPTGMEIGDYQGQITINSNDKVVVIGVSLKILPAPVIAQGVVISEIQLDKREFIELYNASDEDRSLDGWVLCYYAKEKDQCSKSWKFPEGSAILTQSHFLIGVYDYLDEIFPETDWDLLNQKNNPYGSDQLSNLQGSISIINDQGEIIDLVGWGETLMKRGDSAKAAKKDFSLSRRKNSQYLYINNEDNLTDFKESIPSPTNSRGETIISPIEDLRVECGVGTAQLYWTAPGVNQELYYNESAPIYLSGSDSSYLLKLLNYDTDYSFRIKVGTIESNLVSCRTKGIDYSTVWPMESGSIEKSGKLSATRSVPLIDDPKIELILEGNGRDDYIYSPIIVDHDNSFYFLGKMNNREGFLAYDNQGKEKWFFPIEIYRASYPMMLPDGSIILLSRIGYEKTVIILINRDGSIEWEEEIDGVYPTGQPVVLDNRLYLLLSEKAFAFDLDRREILWEYDIGKTGRSIVIGQNLFFSAGNTLYSLDFNGELIAKREFSFGVYDDNQGSVNLSDPVVYQNLLYLTASETKIESYYIQRDFLFLFDQSNIEDEIWSRDVFPNTWYRPVMNHDGEVFIYNLFSPPWLDVNFLGYDSSGQQLAKWEIKSSSFVRSILVDNNNIIYAMIGDSSKVFAFTPRGEKLMEENLDLSYYGVLALGGDGTIFAGGLNRLYTITQE